MWIRFAFLFAVTASGQNYELVYDGGECFSSDKRLYAGDDSVAECAAACASDSDGCAYFIFRPTGNTQCYAEYPSNPTADNNYCGEGFDSDSYDFYRLLPDFYLITTGTCPSGHLITDAAQCEAAATAFSMSDTTVTSSSSTWSGRPEGCVLHSEYGSDTLYLQTAASTYDSCTSSKKCLCMPPFGETAPPSAAPTPTPTSPTPVPTPDGYGAKMFLTRRENRCNFWF